jgi:hypothetical protein
MAVSTLLAVWIILLLPSDSAHMARSILLILLVVALALISNTLNIVALALNKERSGGSR